MTVSIDATSRKYRGRKAETYEAVRTKQERWDIENRTVEQMIRYLRPRSVLDVPVGTGRFLRAYDRFGVTRVIGVDVSDEMLVFAAKKALHCQNRAGIRLICDDVRSIAIKRVDVSVCVRFLDLIDDEAMRAVLITLMTCTRKAIICTIRLGPTYIAKSNTATHDEPRLRRFLRTHDWKIARAVPVFNLGWHILLLRPR